MAPAGTEGPGSERDRICAALVEVVSERGYQWTSLDLVLHRAEVSEAAFGRQFESLDACFAAVWDGVDAELRSRMAPVCGDPDGWQDRLRDALFAGLDYLARHQGHARIYFAEVIYVNDVLRERQRASLNRLGAAIDRGRLAHPKPDRALRHVADAIAGAIWSRIHQLVRAGKITALTDEVPLAMYLAVMPYLGTVAAEAELRRPLSG